MIGTDSVPYRAPGSDPAQDVVSRPQADPPAAAVDPPVAAIAPPRRRAERAALARLLAFPELFGVLAVAAALNLWNLQINGWANTYYAAAAPLDEPELARLPVRLDRPGGLMTVDKPPLAVLGAGVDRARIFGFHPLSILVPQALMGVAAAGLMYDLVRRRFGRIAGFDSRVALATTPTIVAVSRHNNPDELLVLLSVAAVWFALRALETGRTRWLVWCGVVDRARL